MFSLSNLQGVHGKLIDALRVNVGVNRKQGYITRKLHAITPYMCYSYVIYYSPTRWPHSFPPTSPLPITHTTSICSITDYKSIPHIQLYHSQS